MEAIALRSDRVTLSVPTEEDIDVITQCCQDAAIQRWTTVPSPYARSDAGYFVSTVVATGWADGTSCTWGIRQHEGARLVGMVSLDRIAYSGAELGYWLSPDARGLGLMNEAVRLACDFAFAADDGGGLGLQRLQWHAFVPNAASASVARRAGFQFEGLSRLDGVHRGKRLDSWGASLLATDPRGPAAGWPAETFAE